MLKKLILNEKEKECLANYGYLEIKRGDFLLIITRNEEEGEVDYTIHLPNPYSNESINRQMLKYYSNNKLPF